MGLTERHWFENEDTPENYEWALEDAVMLKKQEAKEPVIARAIPLGHGATWGYWFKCSACGYDGIHESAKNFCPDCGAKLEG